MASRSPHLDDPNFWRLGRLAAWRLRGGVVCCPGSAGTGVVATNVRGPLVLQPQEVPKSGWLIAQIAVIPARHPTGT